MLILKSLINHQYYNKQKRFGQLGQGDRNDITQMGDSLPVIDLGSGKTAKAITAGLYHTCVLLNDDSVKCFGYNG